MSYTVRFTRQAEADLQRLFVFILEREMERPGGGDFALADDYH